MELKTGADAFAAAGLTEIRHRGGNLEWPVKLLLGAQRVVRYGVVAGAGPTGAERRAGPLNLTLLSLPYTCDARGAEPGGRAIKGISPGPAVG